MQYHQDPQNPTYIGAYEWGGKSGIGRDDFVQGQRNSVNSKYGTRAGFGPATRPLNRILYSGGFVDHLKPTFNRTGAMEDTKLDLDLFRCPADDGPPRRGVCADWIAADGRSSYDHFGTSYAANLFMVASGPGLMHSNSPYLRPTTRVPSPARTIYYEENLGRWAWAAKRETCDLPGVTPGVDPGPTKVIRGWHRKDWTYNRSFVDTHAEYQKVYLEGTEDRDGYALHYVAEHISSYPGFDSDNDGSPDGPGSYEFYRCVIVRGGMGERHAAGRARFRLRYGSRFRVDLRTRIASATSNDINHGSSSPIATVEGGWWVPLAVRCQCWHRWTSRAWRLRLAMPGPAAAVGAAAIRMTTAEHLPVMGLVGDASTRQVLEGATRSAGSGMDAGDRSLRGKRRLFDSRGLLGLPVVGDACRGPLHVISDGTEFEIFRVDKPARNLLTPHPLNERRPEAAFDQDDRESLRLARLDQGHGFEKLVERAEAAGKADEGHGVTSRT